MSDMFQSQHILSLIKPFSHFRSQQNLIMYVKVDNAKLNTCFFKQCESDKSLYYCRNEKCKAVRGKKKNAHKQHTGKGYTNLRNHLRACVGENFKKYT